MPKIGSTSEPIHVVCPGSFDPVHLAHLKIIEQAFRLSEQGRLLVVIQWNATKPDRILSLRNSALLVQTALPPHLQQPIRIAVSGSFPELMNIFRAYGSSLVARGAEHSRAKRAVEFALRNGMKIAALRYGVYLNFVELRHNDPRFNEIISAQIRGMLREPHISEEYRERLREMVPEPVGNILLASYDAARPCEDLRRFNDAVKDAATKYLVSHSRKGNLFGKGPVGIC